MSDQNYDLKFSLFFSDFLLNESRKPRGSQVQTVPTHTQLEDLEIVFFFFFSSFDSTKMKQYIHASRLVGYITDSDIS